MEEFLAIDWVKRITEKEGFHQFSLSEDELGHPLHVMAEFEEGRTWHVKAYVSDPEGLDLPQWRRPTQPTP
jgi:hypothetical protein